MAVICPFVGWWVYRLIAGASPVQSARHWFGGAVGGWLGLSVAALVAGTEFGLQPLIAHDAAGRALYCPFGLNIAIPAMFFGHLLVFGIVEGIITALVIVYFQRAAPEMLDAGATLTRQPLALLPKMALILGILILLAPLGLIIPAYFHAGSAWGEWSSAEIKAEVAKITRSQVGYVPRGLYRAEQHGWKAPLPDYALPGEEQAKLATLSRSYILAGAVGVIVIGFFILLFLRMFARKEDADDATHMDARSRQA